MPRSTSRRNTRRRASRPGLRAHYLAARYVVGDGPECFVLRVDASSEPLLALHRLHGVQCSAFLTACNPRSELRDAIENERAQHELVALLQQRGHVCVAGRGVDPAGRWPDEPSVLALGIAPADAEELALRFGQNALLVTGEDGVPRLHWMQGPAAR